MEKSNVRGSWTLIARWKEMLATFALSVWAATIIGGWIYQAVAEDRVEDTAKKVSEAEVKKHLQPIQEDMQLALSEIEALKIDMQTMHSQQVEILSGIEFLKEIQIESNKDDYEAVLKRRRLRDAQ